MTILKHKTDGSKPANWNGYNVYDGRETECQKLKHEEHIKELKAENAKLKKDLDKEKKDSLDFRSKGLVLEKQYEVLKRSRDKLAEALVGEGHYNLPHTATSKTMKYEGADKDYYRRKDAVESYKKLSEQE